MSSVDKLQVQKLLAKGDSIQMGDNESVALRLKYTGSGSVSSVTVTTATKIALTTSEDSGLDFTFATYSTVGSLVDAINEVSYWEAKTLDALRSTSTTSSELSSASKNTQIGENNVYDVVINNSNLIANIIRLTYDRGFQQAIMKKGHRVKMNELVYNETLGGTSSLDIYEVDSSGTEILKLSGSPTSGTETTLNFANGEVALTPDYDKDLVVKISDDTSITGWMRVVYTKE
ncbi:hypothetical protein AKJ56_01005 [candidate division MSBL1 archaeon SCGC-AAA382N08]|uniref:Uncharacterized protein n=1 Tax=candidate division MSBL1 archaeon SCGC-AAA382N08 TaxID=1698285 RepID=A0A133VQ64_9EURY|nr:hypothetical protein AKJ56_01005 [candidate division MSBL1 archaeon SCGC-AAA382N08]